VPFYGPAETVAASWSYTKRLVRERIQDAAFEDGPLFKFPMSAEDQKQIPFRVSIGAPNLEAFSQGAVRSKYNSHPMDGHLLFAPVIPKTGEAALEATRLLAGICAEQRVPGLNPLFVAPQAWLYRSFVMVAGFPVSRSDPKVNATSRASFLKALKIAAERGWGEYRASPVFSDAVSDIYSYNGHALRRFTESLKDAADPNGILAPGRAGIWPKHLRRSPI
jgi:4-cresol dehydrogenase (hydroxylating)